ncbi:MAG: restriction endonuclease, SacI family [Solirubrobacteraceae bacterium]
MPITLHADDLARTLERAYVLAIGKQKLSATWTERAEQLAESPSVAFIAAVGSVLLAKATNPAVDAFVIQARDGSAGAFNLRAAASALGAKKRAFGYDIGSSSDRDPINHGTLIGSTRWDVALERIREDHKPFFQLILAWLVDVNRMSSDEATEALAAYLRVRRMVGSGASVRQIPAALARAPALPDLVGVLDGFVGADPEGGARGMALVAAAYRAAGFDAVLPSRNDPRRIDVSIRRDGVTVIGAEVKQIDTKEATADTLAVDAVAASVSRALLAVLRPGVLIDFDRAAVIRRAEKEHNVVLRVVHGTRELLHEALSAGNVDLGQFCAALPRLFAEALREIRAAEQTLLTWTSIASRWE